MPRPYKRRRIRFRPDFDYYKPAGVPLNNLEEVRINADEMEALVLSDVYGFNQKDAAEKMEISQPTFHRILSSARKKIASALSTGKAIRIKRL